jgi:cold shock CspA family protein
MQGTVNRIPEGKMFGFIKVEGEKNDYFFHKDDFSGHWQDLVHDITLITVVKR